MQIKLEASNLVCCDVIWPWLRLYLMYAMFLIVSWQPAGAIWLSLISVKTRVSIQSSCNSWSWWTTTMEQRHWPWSNAGDYGDHVRSWRWRSKAQRRKAISYHILWIACDVNPLCILYCLVNDGSIIRWSLKHTISSFKVFILSKHRC